MPSTYISAMTKDEKKIVSDFLGYNAYSFLCFTSPYVLDLNKYKAGYSKEGFTTDIMVKLNLLVKRISETTAEQKQALKDFSVIFYREAPNGGREVLNSITGDCGVKIDWNLVLEDIMKEPTRESVENIAHVLLRAYRLLPKIKIL